MSRKPASIPVNPRGKDCTNDPVSKRQDGTNTVPMFDADNPFKLFSEWFGEAQKHEEREANAMALATVDATGAPDVRIVLLKDFDENGFVFYSNANSSKGQQFSASLRAALNFHWKFLRRQVRIRGSVMPVGEDAANAYFASRSRNAQIGAWASEQSSELESRDWLEEKIRVLEEIYDGQEVPRPPHWRGWRIKPLSIEFWRDRPSRLHDRLQFVRPLASSPWTKRQLYP